MDAAYCYRPCIAWSVCRSVCRSRDPAKTAEPIDMPSGLWARVGSRKFHVLDGVHIAPCEGTIFRGKDIPVHARRHSAVSCAKMAEPMPIALSTRMGPRKHALHGVHSGATWQRCTLFVKLL